MNKKKSIAVAIVLLLILLIGGMLAYFTDTEVADNVFTLGDKIDISLSETAWSTADTNNNNVPDAAEKIHPGTSLNKNPVIKNESTTTPAYVFAEVIVPCYHDNYDDTTGNTTVVVDKPLFSLNTIGTGWTLMSTSVVDTDNKVIKYVYNYGDATTMTALAANQSTTPVFSSITLDSSITDLEAGTAPANPSVKVNAYAIQTDGYSATTPSAIFALYTTQNTTSTTSTTNP